MMTAGTETGSLINHVLSGANGGVTPTIGMGATVLCWSDRHAGTVVKVTRCTLVVQEDTATRTDTNGRSEVQAYDYARNPDGRLWKFRLTKRGWRAEGSGGQGNGLLLGDRRKYHDYSF